jgi:hypothetical protein
LEIKVVDDYSATKDFAQTFEFEADFILLRHGHPLLDCLLGFLLNLESFGELTADDVFTGKTD